MRFETKSFLLGLAIAIGASAIAAEPFEMSSLTDEATRVGGPTKSIRLIADANTTTHFIPSENGGSVPAVFSWNTTVMIHSRDEATCCLLMTNDGTIGTQATTAATTFTDGNGPDGAAACVPLAPNERHDVIPHFRSLTRAIGGRLGVCSGFVRELDGDNVRPPCRVDADCATTFGISGGTCNTSPTVAEQLQSGALIACKALNASTKITVGPER